jgi:hypothetical protein
MRLLSIVALAVAAIAVPVPIGDSSDPIPILITRQAKGGGKKIQLLFARGTSESGTMVA